MTEETQVTQEAAAPVAVAGTAGTPEKGVLSREFIKEAKTTLTDINGTIEEAGRDMGDLIDETPVGRILSAPDGPGAFLSGLMQNDLFNTIIAAVLGIAGVASVAGGNVKKGAFLTALAGGFGTGAVASGFKGLAEGAKPGESVDCQGGGEVAKLEFVEKRQGHTGGPVTTQPEATQPNFVAEPAAAPAV